ncbi:MAG: ATP-binding protein [Deltaproteobacteria bacterium]|nr:ATP-binding protein [Deltaproteobacteria bacterium]
MYVRRIIPLERELEQHSILLLGPRRTGKSAYIREQAPPHRVYDLMKSDVFLRLSRRPALIRESLEADDRLIVIDEIQKLPVLMDEVHVMIEETGVRFLLTGSSARKLKRTHTSLMAGRARTRRLQPFVYPEIEDFDLQRVLQFGSLPPVYLSDEPEEELHGYAGTYLQEEIQAEALSRNIEGFSRFLVHAALWNGEVLNFEGVGRDAQVPARTIREYYSVLEDTLIGTMLTPLSTTGKRKAISRGKFYFFDIGVVHALSGSFSVPAETPMLGKAFEHFIWQELFAYHQYFARRHGLHFWRDVTGAEVDFVLGKKVAIEVKSSTLVHDRQLRGLVAITQQDDHAIQRRIVVCREPRRRRTSGIEIVPYQDFLSDLWSHRIL